MSITDGIWIFKVKVAALTFPQYSGQSFFTND